MATCEELQELHLQATLAVVEAHRSGRFAELRRDKARIQEEQDRKIYALIKHLLVGHAGQPCPAGDRPIIKPQSPY